MTYNKYQKRPSISDQIDRNYASNEVTLEKAKLKKEIRDKCRDLAYAIDGFCPKSRERSTAFTKLEEAMMWALLSIDRMSEDDDNE